MAKLNKFFSNHLIGSGRISVGEELIRSIKLWTTDYHESALIRALTNGAFDTEANNIVFEKFGRRHWQSGFYLCALHPSVC